MKKRNILTLSALGITAVTLASCSNNSSTEANLDAYDTNVAKTWFKNGDTSDNYQFSEHYTTKIYDPSLEEGFSSTSYYTLYTYSDVESILRITKTEITDNAFKSNGTSCINYLSCYAFSSSYQSNFASDIEKATISLPDYASCQTTWQKSLADYNLTESNLEDGETNYLYVVYMPVFVRYYSDSKISLATFICVPVYATITLDENTTTNTVVKSYREKIASFEYSNSVIK